MSSARDISTFALARKSLIPIFVASLLRPMILRVFAVRTWTTFIRTHPTISTTIAAMRIGKNAENCPQTSTTLERSASTVEFPASAVSVRIFHDIERHKNIDHDTKKNEKNDRKI